jgi:hypothetical protein
LANTTAPSAANAWLNQDSFDASHETHERLPPRLKRPQAQVLPIETQKIEGHERGLSPAPLGEQRYEVAPLVPAQHHRFAVDQRRIRGEAADRLADGTTENLTTDLSRLNGSFVIA